MKEEDEGHRQLPELRRSGWRLNALPVLWQGVSISSNDGADRVSGHPEWGTQEQDARVIKVVWEINGGGWSLKEAKDLVDHAPRPVKQGVSREEAEDIIKKLKRAGAEAEIR